MSYFSYSPFPRESDGTLQLVGRNVETGELENVAFEQHDDALWFAPRSGGFIHGRLRATVEYDGCRVQVFTKRGEHVTRCYSFSSDGGASDLIKYDLTIAR